MAANYKDGLFTQVFFSRGRVENTQKKRFSKAPFFLVQFDGGLGDLYLMTDSMSIGNADKYTDDTDNSLHNGWGYLTLQDVVIGEHEMGSWQDPNPTWKSCHSFGLI